MDNFSKRLLKLGDNELDSEMAFIVDAMLRSAAWGIGLMLAFVAWSSTLTPGGIWDGILAARFEIAYGSFHLGFGGAALRSIAHRLAILATGVPLHRLRGRAYEVASPVLFSLTLAIGLCLAVLVGIPFMGLAKATAENFWLVAVVSIVLATAAVAGIHAAFRLKNIREEASRLASLI